MVRDYLGRDFPRPHQQWTETRFPPDAHLDTTRYHEAPLTTIGDALRERCKIPAAKYFVAAILDNGKAVYYGGPDEWHKKELNTFFDARAFETAAKRHVSSGPVGEDGDYGGVDEYGRHTGVLPSSEYGHGLARRGYAPRRSGHVFDPFDEDGSYKARKRPRAFRREIADGGDDDPPAPVRMANREIRVDDSKAIWDFCDMRFKNLQQTACKLAAKAWVKLVEPKKQSTHPYTGAEEKAPDWWPKPWGLTKEEKVRHKEPDHLYKKERVHLLNHILCMIVEPNHLQHPDIQKLHLNVAKLEEATFEALSAFFFDKDNPSNAKKKPFLKEIFKIAKAQERYKNGEVDGDFKVYVMADDKFPDDWQSGDEDASGSKKTDDDQSQPRHSDRASASSHASPQKPPTATTHGGILPVPGGEQSPTTPIHHQQQHQHQQHQQHQPQHHAHQHQHHPHHHHSGGSGGGPTSSTSQHFLSDIPVRAQSLSTGQVLTSDLAAPDVHAYVDTTPIHHTPSNPPLQDMYGTTQQQSATGAPPRRTAPSTSSIFSSPTDYSPGSGGPGPVSGSTSGGGGGGPTSASSAGPGPTMYPPWQTHGLPVPSTAPSSAPMYTFASQSQQPTNPSAAGPPTSLQAPFVTQGAVQLPTQYTVTGAATPGSYQIDGLPREPGHGGYDAAAAGMFRTMAALPPQAGVPQPGGPYQGYMSHDGRGGGGPGGGGHGR